MTSSVFFNHSRHLLRVRKLDAQLDVLTFTGQEHLSQPFTYDVEFTSTERDLAADRLLGRSAIFSLYAAPQKLPLLSLTPPPIKPLRTLYGVVTGFKRLSGSKDEARYEITLQPRLALLEESAWLRLARPYAGDTHGLHLPLIVGTEVAVAFEQGDPDRPYIAHALHDSRHVDQVTSNNYKRNVLCTPANTKLRMDDTRGQEHIKLSTEHSGKSQLNLGHLVDGKRQPRGQGAELRTDGHAAIRAGSGIFISADAQPKAQGQMLEMSAALGRLEQAGEQLQGLSVDARAANADPADVQAQLNLLTQNLEQLKSSVVLLSAPHGVAVTSGQHLQLAAQNNLMINAGAEADISVVKRLFIGVGQGVSLFVRKLGIKLIANQGAVSIQAQNDTLELIARHGLSITSTEDEIHITAKKKITLNAGGSYITLDQSSIVAGTQGDHLIKSAYFDFLGPAQQVLDKPQPPQLTEHESESLKLSVFSG